MKTVLLAWEFGAGTGHAVALRRYAARLRPHGVRLIAAVRNDTAVEGLLDLGVAILQAPLWPGVWLTPDQRKMASSATMTDILAEAGLLDEAAFVEVIRQWDDIFGAVRPDVVVGDYAPALALTARGRIPLILTGNGYTLPPSEMANFPPLHDFSPPRWNESDVLAAVNRMVRSTGVQPLDRMTQMFAADARIVESFPILDPYAAHRAEPVDSPVFDHIPPPRRDDADRIVVYLAPGVAIHRDIVDALRPFAARVHIHAPELSDTQRSHLIASGTGVQDQPFVLSETLPHARLIIHLGGSGVASHALACGVPQLVIAGHIEQELNGAALTRAGLGQIVRGYDRTARISTDMIAGMLDDKALAQRAADAGADHRAVLQDAAQQNKGPLEKFERAALSLMGLKA
jgi:UDP:flavonoid glycosyltransferase YjiC (YdhE family)